MSDGHAEGATFVLSLLALSPPQMSKPGNMQVLVQPLTLRQLRTIVPHTKQCTRSLLSHYFLSSPSSQPGQDSHSLCCVLGVTFPCVPARTQFLAKPSKRMLLEALEERPFLLSAGTAATLSNAAHSGGAAASIHHTGRRAPAAKHFPGEMLSCRQAGLSCKSKQRYPLWHVNYLLMKFWVGKPGH